MSINEEQFWQTIDVTVRHICGRKTIMSGCCVIPYDKNASSFHVSYIETNTTNIRLIARLDVKGPNVIKGVQLEGLRQVGDPNLYAKKYYEHGADEILFMDTVASLYGRNNLTDVVRKSVKDIFIPVTVGGGIRSVEDARHILRSGVDKVAINTAATKHPELISELAEKSVANVVLSIEAKRLTIHLGGLCR